MSDNNETYDTETSSTEVDNKTMFDDGVFVIYSETEEDVLFDAQTEFGKETGFVGVSLWVRQPDDGIEIPIFSQSEQGTWLSMDADVSENTSDAVVSDAFIEALAHFTGDTDATNGWGGVVEDTWDMLSKQERFMIGHVRNALLHGSPPPELLLLIESCRNRCGIMDSVNGDES